MKTVYKQEEIFQDIPGDDKNVKMTIPEDIMKSQGWKEGDTIRVEWGDHGTIVITKVENDGKT